MEPLIRFIYTGKSNIVIASYPKRAVTGWRYLTCPALFLFNSIEQYIFGGN